MILFVDTEWADTLANELVSLALVSDCGTLEFYAERDPLPQDATEFVRTVVYPLLDRGDTALPDSRFTQRLHEFFGAAQRAARPGKVMVAFDHRNDIDLLGIALDAFHLPESPPHPVFDTLNLATLGAGYNRTVEECFARDAALQARRHNALVDARVNRDAYLAMKPI